MPNPLANILGNPGPAGGTERHRGLTPSACVAATAVVRAAGRMGADARILFGAVLIAEDGVIRVGDRTVVMENAPREVAEYLAAHRIHAWNGHNYAWELTESPGIRDSGSAVRVGWCATTTLRTWTVGRRRSRISMVTASLVETCPDDHACRRCPS